MKLEHDRYTLASGRVVYANNGFLGISPPDPGQFVEIREGYDGLIYDRRPDLEPEWTPEERREVAEYAIKLWNAFARGARICAECLSDGTLRDGSIVHEAACRAKPLPGEESVCRACGALTGQLHRDDCSARPRPA